MNQAKIEMKERIKLNAEYRKYSKLVNHKKTNENHIVKYEELKSKLFKVNQYGYVVPIKDYIDNIRLYHIAYSLSKGRTYEQIENKVHDNKVLSKDEWEIINKIKISLHE